MINDINLKPQLYFEELVGTAVVKSIGSDGIVYAVASESSNRIVRSSDGGETWEIGFSWRDNLLISDNVIYITHINNRYIAYLTTVDKKLGSVWVSDSFFSNWIKVLDTLFFQAISISPPQIDYAGNTILLIGEYGSGSVERKLWLSRDGAVTWSSIYVAKPNNHSQNCHIHHACYDPISNHVYISVGDGYNSFFGYSIDWGKTWIPVAPNGLGPDFSGSKFNQPTILYPLSTNICTTPDGSKGKAGVWSMDRGSHQLKVAIESIAVMPYKAFPIYPNCRDNFHEKLYLIYFPTTNEADEACIVGTLDGGFTWRKLCQLMHRKGLVHFPIVGFDNHGFIYYATKFEGKYQLYRALDVSLQYV